MGECIFSGIIISSGRWIMVWYLDIVIESWNVCCGVWVRDKLLLGLLWWGDGFVSLILIDDGWVCGVLFYISIFEMEVLDLEVLWECREM